MTEIISPTKIIDVKGLFCPEPVFRTKIEVERMNVGEILKVLADDPEAEEDISRWVNRIGHEMVSFTKENNELIFMIKKVK
ncbi:MAG: sulfurtransferase TusA family protein [Thaumarchaeota archaeon]|nr:sulfurtransferase TusA family protein [Nitrososphaerota archaeon]